MNLAINNVTNLCTFVGKMVCVCVCVSLLLSHFLPFKIHLTNILPILIKMADFKNLAWETSFATWARRKFIYLSYRASGEKSYCHTLMAVNAVDKLHRKSRCNKFSDLVAATHYIGLMVDESTDIATHKKKKL